MRPRLEDPRHRRTSLAVSATVTGTISPAPGVPGRWHPQTVKRIIEARHEKVKESPQEVGFFIGAFVGFLWLVYAGVRGGSHGYMGGLYWIFISSAAASAG